MENVSNTTLESGHHADGSRTNEPHNSNSRPGRGRRGEQPTGSASQMKRNRHPKGSESSKSSNMSLSEGKTPANDPGWRKPSSKTAVQEGSRRRANFGASLTKPDEAQSSKQSSIAPATQSEKRKGKSRQWLPQGDDLTSSLIRDLSTPPYYDCPICFSAIQPQQPIWSCSPSIPIVVSNEAQVREYCWSAFHLKCIRSWAEKSVKSVADAWRARGDYKKNGDWRCPGCQAKREIVPSSYWCFCHSQPEPKPPRLSTPHSCGASCSRPRESGCGHPCPLQCHPGPCPPCQITVKETCYCLRKKPLTFVCGTDGRGRGKGAPRNLSCGNVCDKALNCGKHTCQRQCHDGACNPCEVMEDARCWCGKEERKSICGVGEGIQCFVEGETPWIGRFGCDNACGRFFDCGRHQCEKPCHPPSSKPATCPRSPSKITSCPCGRCSIAPTPSQNGPQYTFPARRDCSDPVPTCDAICSKAHPGCEHACTAVCHDGTCPPCNVETVRPCRCGATTTTLPCHMVNSESSEPGNEILCDKPCQALRACGRHQCRRLCCPLASLAVTTGRKGKKRAVNVPHDVLGIGEDQGGLHECDLPCGKALSCGNHMCELKDHKGACPSCLRSSFEELICPCGRTVYEPPIPCGTRMECTYFCPRPRTTCEHQNIEHQCHDDSVPCPPCPHLTDKVCACGKMVVSNIRCSLETEKVSCGTTCGKLMSCGFHHCDRFCHSDPCGLCTAQCGKSRKSCLPNNHPCTRPCHAPSNCPETEPCQAFLTLTCPCGRIKQSVPCGRTSSSGSSTRTSQSNVKCTNDCLVAKRNARLAEALGINTEAKDKTTGNVVYNDELTSFARANSKFLALVEKAFSDFVSSEKRTQVLPHMPVERRKFVHDLASIYRMDSQMIDQEPHRSVQLLRRIDTRIPCPLLSTYIATTAPPPSLGRLANLRTIREGASASSATSAPSNTSAASSVNPWRTGNNDSNTFAPAPKVAPIPIMGTQRGWASVIAKPPAAASAAIKPTSRTSTPPLTDSQIRLAGANKSRTSSPAPVSTAVDSVPDSWEEDT